MKPKLKPPGTMRLKLICDTLLSTSAFKFSLRRCFKAASHCLDAIHKLPSDSDAHAALISTGANLQRAFEAGSYTRPPFSLT